MSANRRGPGWRDWLILGASALLFPAIARAQSVRGQVLDARDSLALAGVLVQLIDSSGVTVSRALTNERGEFLLLGSAAGPHRVRTLRIGYRPADSPPIRLETSAEATRAIVVAGVPVVLDTVRVLARNPCNVPTDSAAATFAIWEQARTALTVALLTTRARPYTATLVRFERVLDPDMRRIRGQTTTVGSGVGGRSWVSIPADSLRRVGYVLTGRDGSATYYAPDLEVLLSREFAEDHCFRLARSGDRSRIGIAFEPTSERATTAEIKGTLWFDRRSAELRRLEFGYTNLFGLQAQHAGGSMEFIRLRTGAWLVSRWNIRMPVPRLQAELGYPGLVSPNTLRIAEVKVVGGELASVTRGRDTLWTHAPMTLSGTVQDSASSRAVAAARVRLRGTTVDVASDPRGRFTIPNALPGDYVVEIRTASLDSIGVIHSVPVTIADTAAQVRLRLPSTLSVLAALCGDSLMGVARAPLGAVFGTVHVRGDSVPPNGVAIALHWREYDVGAGRSGSAMIERTRGRAGRTDRAGMFRVCGVPLNTPVLVRTALDERSAAATPARIPPGQRFTYVDVIVDPPAGSRPPDTR